MLAQNVIDFWNVNDFRVTFLKGQIILIGKLEYITFD